MPPQIASFLFYGFIVWLFLRDIRERPNITGALWLPLIWLLLLATRNPSHWLAMWGIPGFTSSSLEEGSALDATVYLGLIVAGSAVLVRRQVRIGAFLGTNGWLVAFLLYCLIATIWADFPYVGLKRWIKILGHPIMALVIFTEPNPFEALKRLIFRSSYIILPISILFIKYLPHLGRKAGGWATQASNNGITTGKNMLGNDCLILGLFLFWFLLVEWNEPKSPRRTKNLRLIVGLLAMMFWCLDKASSATSWMALLVGVMVMLIVRYPAICRKVGTYMLITIVVIGTAEVTVDLSARIAEWRGKGDTAAGRADLWKLLLETDTNPVIGVGFESYWIGERLQSLWARPEFQFWKPNQAHNGYLEVYLNLGLVGLALLLGIIVQAYRNCRSEVDVNFSTGRFRLGMLVAILAYNWMEATFKGLSVVFFSFYIVALMPRYLISQEQASDSFADDGFDEKATDEPLLANHHG